MMLVGFKAGQDQQRAGYLSIPSRYSVAHTIGFPKGKRAVRIHRDLLHKRRMTGLSFEASGYSVSTVGLDEARVCQYIREQEKLESGQGKLDLKQTIDKRPNGASYVTAPDGGFTTRWARSGEPSQRHGPWPWSIANGQTHGQTMRL